MKALCLTRMCLLKHINVRAREILYQRKRERQQICIYYINKHYNLQVTLNYVIINIIINS